MLQTILLTVSTALVQSYSEGEAQKNLSQKPEFKAEWHDTCFFVLALGLKAS